MWLQVVNLVAFRPFKSALEALQQINAISDGLATEELLSFLELNLPKVTLFHCLHLHAMLSPEPSFPAVDATSTSADRPTFGWSGLLPHALKLPTGTQKLLPAGSQHNAVLGS